MRHLLLFAALFLVSCGQEESSLADPPRPNIVYILADDLGYGDVGAFSPDGKIKTPHLDRLAREGMMFTDAHTSSAVCTPTRYGILTGRYSWRSRLKQGVTTGVSPALIPEERMTVASLLKERGYETACIGKWHLGWEWTVEEGKGPLTGGWQAGDTDGIDFTGPVRHTPTDLGFDYAYNLPASLDIAPYVYVENGKVTSQPDRITVDTSKYGWWREGPTGSDFDHERVTPNFIRRAAAFVTEAAAREAPYFLYLPLPSPHTPILPEAKWRGKSGLNPYGDFIAMLDDYLGQLLDAIAVSGEAEHTLVIFTSDNGPSPEADFGILAEKGHRPNGQYRGHKADLYEGGHRVPFIVHWPAVVAPGSRSSSLLCTTDLLATVAELTQNELPANAGEDSHSFLPVLTDPEHELRSSVVHHSVSGRFALRAGPWKLLMVPGSGGWSYPSSQRHPGVTDTLPPRQLYHLGDDPGEVNNLVKRYPGVADSLQTVLVNIIRKGRSTPGEAQTNDAAEKGWPQADFAGME